MIELKNVTKSIHDNLILDDINLILEDGKIYGFFGSNGSGKTMIFRAICGLITIDSGEVIINGQSITDNDLPPDIGLLLEKPTFINGLSGFENLKMIAQINKIAGDERINEVLEILGLTGAKNKKYETYSLGMKQKLGIANVILEWPKILIFDEPTNAIDEQGIVVLKEIIKNEKNNGKLILIASHEKEIIEELCDEVYYMSEGKITNKS